MTRVLVAGATGYLGRFVARELLTRGYQVRALARDPERLGDLGRELDEVARGEVTRPDTIAGVCDGVEVVFSSVGITRQRDGLTWRDVDYQGNKNLLQEALRAGVRKFIYISTVDGPSLTHLDIIRAHEDFVAELVASGMDYTVIRATGFFSDMEELLQMARRGRVYLFGRGDCRVNPIHGADLATCCADTLEDDRREVAVGGPQVYTWREIATMALDAWGKPPRITAVPLWIMRSVIWATRLLSRHQAELLAFFTTMATRDVVAPATGHHTLEAHYRQLAGGR